MNRTWNLREELYKSMHRWPMMLALFAIGCFLGWLVALVWPPYYRAISEMYVALNPYRTYSDATFLALTKPKYSNLDNYLFWQMAQLEQVVYLDQFIQETLWELQQLDPYWENITEDQLRTMLEADWRAAGKWSLIAQNRNANYAQQAVKTWSKVVKEGSDHAILSARDTFMIDQKLQSVSTERLQAELRIEELQSIKRKLTKWLGSDQEITMDQQLPPTERWELLATITQIAQFTPTWQTILNQQPPEEAPLEDYRSWVEKILPTIENELATLDQRITTLDEKHRQLAEQYSNVADQSLGLSPNLAMEEVVHQPPKLVRPTSTLILVGGILGLLIWVFSQFVMITKHTTNDE